MVQLNGYEKAPCFIRSSQNLTSFLPVFTLCDHKIVPPIKTKQFYDHIRKTLVKIGKNTEMSLKYNVKFCLNGIKYGAVSYSLSCTVI